jgi:hypothetical protein
MGKQERDVQTNYHIRFNPKNDRHLSAASYLTSVRGKYKIAFLAAAIEAYRQTHPHGVDYEELEEIQKRSWRPIQPKVPILENLTRKWEQEPARAAPVPIRISEDRGDAQADEAIDKAMSHYGIE